MPTLSVAVFDEQWTCSLGEMKIILSFIWTQINTSLHIHHFTWGLIQLFMAVDRNGVILATWDSAFYWCRLKGTDWHWSFLLSQPLLCLHYNIILKDGKKDIILKLVSWYDLGMNNNLRGKDKRIFTLGFHLDLIRELISSKSVLVSQEQFNAVRMSDLFVCFSDKRNKRFSINMWEPYAAICYNILTAKHLNES